MSAGKPIATLRSNTGIPAGRLAVWWLLASEIVIFGGLIAAYLMARFAYPQFGDFAANTNTWIGAFNTFVLLTSSLCAVLAHHAAESQNGRLAAKYLVFTIIGGLVFLCVKSFEWSMEISHGFTITANLFWSFYYTAAGLHALHVIVGLAVMAWVAMSAAKGRELQRVEYVGLYWHFVDVVWIFLFPLLYIAR